MVALITGGAGFLGSSITKMFLDNSYDVVITYKESLDKSHELEEYGEKIGRRVLAVKTDLVSDSDITNLYNKVKEEFGRVDVIVNNAAINNDSIVEDKTREDFLKVLDINLVAPFLLTLKFKELLIKNNGSVINISSNNALDNNYPYSIEYDSSKMGLISLSHNLAKYFAGKVRVNTVCPGWIETKTNDLDTTFKKEEEEKILLKRFALPNEIAEVIYFLATDKASYINDAVIRVDGGARR